MAVADSEVYFCLVRVGALRFLIEPRAVETIEGRYPPPEGPGEVLEVDLRVGLEQPADAGAESLLIRRPEGTLRLVVCGVEQVLRGRLESLHPLPRVLRRYGRRLGLRGVAELPDGVAYLAEPQALGEALLDQGAAA